MRDAWFNIHRSALAPAFARVSAAVDHKSKIPILAHVLFEAGAGALRLRATDLDLQIDAECELMNLSDEASFAVPAKLLGDILRELPESAEIAFGPGRHRDQVGIRAGRSSFSIPVLPASDFPEMRGRVDLGWTEIDGARLSDALAKTSYALNKNDDRVYLTGYCLHADEAGSGMVVVATDGLSLARIELAGCGCPSFPPVRNTYPHIILPPAGAEPARKLLDGAKVGARIAITGEIFAVAYDGVEISSKLIDGIFPQYDMVIPERTDLTAVLPREAVAAAVKRVCAMVDDAKHDGVRLVAQGDTIKVDLMTALGGFAEDFVPGEIQVPNNFTIAHQATRLEKTLGAIRSVDVELMVRDASTALVIRPLGNNAETYVVSAMRPRQVAD
ncbi:DNA polymerase III subunit beta [Rhizobium sp. ARZ01]|uniref:DNA polymerase III subunit beta n=1 Tax=Rhizobium sp. ARZ01 TaxID=2769313 RepID=UPI0017859BBC|nr:DNA polymerase III subunit beta [Rhizobium sp. ARZ01]MBD9372075.1 DNA polymerase III subunit beta [Rhizobium sp. ARZ01]